GVAMTDVSDLRRRLGELADETPEVSPKQWLAATRHRIRVHHRVRVTGAVGAVALLLAVGPTVVPPMMHSFALKPAEHAPSQVRHWEFVEGAPTHLVLGSRLNQPGASELTWTTVIPHGHPRWVVSSMQFCDLSQTWESSRSAFHAVSYIDGQRLWSAPLPGLGWIPPSERTDDDALEIAIHGRIRHQSGRAVHRCRAA
ncbi:MAG TPA: hypothetical protein VFR22_14040, partial [Nocardioidaceae bacterium]|nr:hypothetical protein [Nocardioidaceae bacterium]